MDMERRLPCCLKTWLRCGVEKNLGSESGDDRRWCFRLVQRQRICVSDTSSGFPLLSTHIKSKHIYGKHNKWNCRYATTRWSPEQQKRQVYLLTVTEQKHRFRPEDAVVWAQSIGAQHIVFLANLAPLTADWCVTLWTVIEACVPLLSQSGGSQLEQMEHPPG